MLRNCSLTGSIPDYIGDLASLSTLDLSFNKLSGEIPGSLEGLSQLNYIDLSYNNFSNAPQSSCDQLSVNLASAYSSSSSNSNSWCLQQGLPCPKSPKHYSLFINCGGGKMSYDGHEYEEDLTAGGPSNFFSSSQKWAYSSTGTYMGNDKANFIASNTFGLNVSGAEFYKSARLAPLSLKYYGLCLRKGSYRVRLHFAEIMYSDDDSFSSLGRRIFDVSIQGQIVFKGFNIADQANGVGKNVTLDFPDIQVIDSTLVIHLYWAGKGTTAIPDRGVYGPLISAISVTPNFHVRAGPSAGVIAGIVIASCVLFTLILVVLRRNGYLRGKDLEDKELRGLELQTGYFTLKQIKAATGNFDPANKIGEGGFGPVYKGVLSDGSVIAVKQLSSKSKQGNREFVNEIGMISALQHPNLVRLYGCCIEGNQLLLIYEYMENNCLARALFGTYLAKLGYMAPEYAMRGYLTDKADVYSFGVVLLEIVSGKSNTNYRPKEDFVYLLDWAYVLQEQGNLLELVDPSLGSKYCEEEAMRMLNLALLCANPSPTLRPSMSSAVSMLDGHIPVQAPIVKRSSKSGEMRFRSFHVLSPDGQTYVTTLSEDSKMQKSMSGPWIDSSISSQIKEGTPEHSNTTKLLLDI
ncbi:Serine-threonine/tyrosine-protein kinase, catalytic domain [Dillenia turbinata]|uniref:non-specific serine/threonine protein kinase n=1 Tax=Dillenia turbinata TaxID=194707 RepID=A0AAN8VVD7_9MAGN